MKLGARISGERGPLVVLLRGLGRWSEHWLGFEKTLSEDFRVLVIDHRGFGLSKDLSCGWNVSIHRMAQDIVDTISSYLRDDEKVHLVAISLGGMIALEIACSNMISLASLTVINSSVKGSGARRLSTRGALAIVQGIAGLETFHVNLARVLLRPDAPEDHVLKLAQAWRDIDAKAKGHEKLTLLKQLMAAARFKPAWHLLKETLPVHIIVGEGDQLVSPANSRYIQSNIPQARLTRIKDMGHEAAFDQPATLRHAISTFIQGTALS